MKNLAGVKDAEGVIRSELLTAGIDPAELRRVVKRPDFEVPSHLVALVRGFTIARGWVYYRVSGVMPRSLAIQLDESPPAPNSQGKYAGGRGVLGDVVRAQGYAGGRSPRELTGDLFKDGYHIDTHEGLTAFVRFLNGHIPVPEAPPQPAVPPPTLPGTIPGLLQQGSPVYVQTGGWDYRRTWSVVSVEETHQGTTAWVTCRIPAFPTPVSQEEFASHLALALDHETGWAHALAWLARRSDLTPGRLDWFPDTGRGLWVLLDRASGRQAAWEVDLTLSPIEALLATVNTQWRPPE